jgi:hypothetical protein
MCRVALAAVIAAITGVAAAAADDDPAELLRVLRAAGPQGRGSAEARAAWDKLVAHGPEVLPAVLAAMDVPEPAARNWLRSAFDHIADRELAAGGKAVPRDRLRAFAADVAGAGPARRTALDLLERLQPGTAAAFVAGRLDDPEFRFEAVAAEIARADKSPPAPAVAAYRQALDAARDVDQIRTAAARLKKHGVSVDVLRHLGFFPEWYVVGPFDARGKRGFAAVYPPEQKVDLAAEYEGKSGKVRWKRVTIPEPQGRTGLLNLRAGTGDADDAVGYAYTAFELAAAVEVEFRGAGDDNLSVWVNGSKEFAFEEYRNGVRLDRHRFKVKLPAGVGTVLVKVCQAPTDPSNPEPNWEFFLRITDGTGKGIPTRSALPGLPERR